MLLTGGCAGYPYSALRGAILERLFSRQGKTNLEEIYNFYALYQKNKHLNKLVFLTALCRNNLSNK